MTNDLATRMYLLDQYGHDLPRADEPFDPHELPGFAGGHWPRFPKEAMLEWLPQSVTMLGSSKTTAFAGSLLHIDEDLRDEVIEALGAEGLEGQEDTENLVPALVAHGDTAREPRLGRRPSPAGALLTRG